MKKIQRYNLNGYLNTTLGWKHATINGGNCAIFHRTKTKKLIEFLKLNLIVGHFKTNNI